MAKVQTRRSVSIRGATYDRLRVSCAACSISMSECLERLISDLLDGKGGAVGKLCVPSRASVQVRPGDEIAAHLVGGKIERVTVAPAQRPNAARPRPPLRPPAPPPSSTFTRTAGAVPLRQSSRPARTPPVYITPPTPTPVPVVATGARPPLDRPAPAPRSASVGRPTPSAVAAPPRAMTNPFDLRKSTT